MNKETKTENLHVRLTDSKPPVGGRSKALEWWDRVDRFAMLKKYGYQDKKNPWKYRPLTDKGIYSMWCQENAR